MDNIGYLHFNEGSQYPGLNCIQDIVRIRSCGRALAGLNNAGLIVGTDHLDIGMAAITVGEKSIINYV